MPEAPVSTNSRNLFALVVGIDRYTSVPALNGCVGDAKAMIDDLNEPLVGDAFKVNLAALFDAVATKHNIVQGFREHLGQAGPGDVALFYLSQEFGVDSPFFEKAELPLDPGRVTKSRKIRGGDYLPFSVPGYVRNDHWDGLHEYVKRVVSEEPFRAELLRMDGLPEPGTNERSTRGAFDAEELEKEEPILPKYRSIYTVELFTMNPYLAADADPGQ